jgi:hypothetical protein
VTPFPGESGASVLYRIVHEDAVDPATAGRGASDEVVALLARALSKKPEDRFATAEAFAEATRRAAVSLQVDAALDPPREREPAPVLEARRAAVRRSTGRYVAGAALGLGLLAAVSWLARDTLFPTGPPPPVWLEADVRTEPQGLPVTLDGTPFTDPARRVRFQSAAPFPTLATRFECRAIEHRLGPADAGGVVTLVADPVEIDGRVDPGIAGANVTLNGARLGPAPIAVRLDLCRDNRLEVRAPGLRPAVVELPAGATPLEARTALYGIALAAIPRGRLVLPASEIKLAYDLDGRRLGDRERDLELEEGEYKLRYRNEYHWIDRETRVAVRGGETVTPDLAATALGTLVVQAFPANCKVYLRGAGGAWRYLDETPASRRVATGRYEVKVVLSTTGEEQVRQVEVGPGDNPPLRVAFGRSS